MMLTQQQRNQFVTFGFFVWRQAFSPAEIADIVRHFESVLEADRQGQRFTGEHRQGVHGFIEQRSELIRLVEDDRIYSSIEELLGPDFVWIGSDGNLYVGDTHWHPDNGEPYQRLKVAFYLDPVTKETGCLRVIPGSHRPQLAERLRDAPPGVDASTSPYGIEPSELPCFPLESEPGDVVFFNQGVWHSAFGGRTGRRMFTLNFGAKPAGESDYENLRRTYQSNLRNVRELQHTQTGRVYTDLFLNSSSERIQRMTDEIYRMGLV
jgi:ectoine hydroxylase-related dioxygenase (phytanoyl-CoA dioxygenase family)